MKNFNAMKYSNSLLKTFLLFLFIISQSCNVEPIDPKVQINQVAIANTPAVIPEIVPVEPVFKVNFDAQVFSASTTTAVKDINGFYTITGSSISNGITRKIQIYFADTANNQNTTGELLPTTAGKGLISYNLNSSLSQNNIYKSFDKLLPQSTTGSIEVTNNDVVNKKISGKFNGTVYLYDSVSSELIGTKVLTNGFFTNINYTDNNPLTNGNSFFAKVDGTDFIEDSIEAVVVQSAGFADSISIVAKKTSGEKIILGINKDLIPNTFNITGPLNNDFVTGKYFINNSLYYANSGNVVLTIKTSTRVSGTFSFVSSSTLNSNIQTISQGTFDVNY